MMPEIVWEPVAVAEGRGDRPCPTPDAIVAFVLGEMDPEDRGLMERHLEGCEACRNVVLALAEAIEDAFAAD